MAGTAIVTIAAHEWRRRRAGLLVIGVLAGLFGGVVVAGAVLTRRSSTAPARLYAAAALGDAQVRAFDRRLADAIVALPMVDAAAESAVAVGRIEGLGAVQYVGVTAPLAPSDELLHPVVVRGRAADPTQASEVMVIEAMATDGRFGVGDALQLSMLTPEEMFQFDTGFGEPDGPKLTLTITGVVRVPPGTYSGTPVLATPAFATAYASSASGVDITLSLRRGAADVAAFTAAVDQLVAGRTDPAPVDDFAPAVVTDPAEGTAALRHSSRVVVGGLLAAVIAAAAAVIVALSQAWSRHQDASAPTQQIERALGLTSIERAAARALPAVAAALVAALVAAAVALAGGVLEPPGALGRAEPHPGWRPDALITLLGSLALAVAVVAGAAAAAWLAGRRATSTEGPRRARTIGGLPQRHGWPLAGSVFALSTSHGNRRAPMRTSLFASVLGVGGIVGALTFTASLDRLTDRPDRYGWTSDVVVVDVNDDVLAELLADARFTAVADSTSATVSIDGRGVDAYAADQRKGTISWTLLEGREPTAPDEVLLGSKLASRLGASVGDVVRVGDQRAGAALTAKVVGVGIGPPVNGERFGVHASFTRDGLARAQSVGNFREAFVRVAPGVAVDDLTAELGARYELTTRSLPAEVRDVADLGSLPALLGGFLAALALVALLHGLVVTAREREEDLAVMRALGSTTRQLQLTMVTVSLVTMLLGLVAGVPLGWAVARLVWGGVAGSIGVAGDIVAPWTIAPAAVAALVVAVAAAAVTTRRIARVEPGQVLRGE